MLLALVCREPMGRACPLCPGISDVDLFRYCQGVIGFDTLNFSTCQSRRSAIIRHIKINGLSEKLDHKLFESFSGRFPVKTYG